MLLLFVVAYHVEETEFGRVDHLDFGDVYRDDNAAGVDA